MFETLSLKLDSSLSGQTSENFRVQYANLSIPGKWQVALKKFHGWYSWTNISVARANNIFRYSNDSGTTWFNITIPDGNYSVSNLNTYIQSKMRQAGHYDAGNDVYYLTIEPNYNTQRCDVILSNNYQIDMRSTVSNMYLLLGFDSKIITASESGTNLVDITNGISTVEIKCSLTDGSYSNEYPSNMLDSFIPNSAPGSSINYTPSPLSWLPVNTQTINSIQIQITDQKGRPINLRGEHVVVVLALRRVE